MSDYISLAEAHSQKANGAIHTDAKRRFPTVSFNDFRMGTGAPYLVKGILPRAGLAVVYGAPKCGKSFWTFDLVMHIAMGQDYRGRNVRQGSALWIALEGDDGIGRRVEAFRQAHLGEDAGDVPLDLLVTRLDLAADYKVLIADIADQLDPVPTIIVIDTLNRSMSGSESSDADMAAYIKAADALREAFGCLIVIIHHCGHSATRPRGHSSLLGAVDVQIAVTRPNPTGAVLTEVEFAKDGPSGAITTSHLKVVEIGTDDEGEPLTSCVIQPADHETTLEKRRRPTGHALKALEMLEKAVIDEGYLPPESADVPRTKRVVREDVWRTFFEAGFLTGADNDADKKATAKRAFRRASSKLQTLGYIGFWDGLVWICS